MHKITVAALPLLALAASASAADFPRSPAYLDVPPARAITWDGFYIGGNLGGGWADARSDFSAAGVVFGTADNHMNGFSGGLQLGYNWQRGPWLLGAETDFQLANIKGSLSTGCAAAQCGVPLAANYEQKMPWFGTVRGRTGYAQDGWLLYVTGGYAYARLTTDASASAGGVSANMSQQDFRNGWTVGGGVEVALTPRWSLKAEYLYLDFGSKSTTWSVTGLPPLGDSTKLNMNVVRTGVNYRF
jgi:outer membrane immunogenic protein